MTKQNKKNKTKKKTKQKKPKNKRYVKIQFYLPFHLFQFPVFVVFLSVPE